MYLPSSRFFYFWEMYFCYIDESGKPHDPKDNLYILAGLAIPDWRWNEYERKIQQIKSKFNLGQAEIHTYYLSQINQFEQINADFFNQSYSERTLAYEKHISTELSQLKTTDKKKYLKKKDSYKEKLPIVHLSTAERKTLLLDLSKEIASWQECRLFAECINKNHFSAFTARNGQPFSMEQQAFIQTATRFHTYLEIVSKTEKKDNYGLLIHDNHPTGALELKKLMNGLRNQPVRKEIKNIIEMPFMVDSKLTSMIQLADLCAYSLKRYLEKNEQDLFNEIFKRADRKNNKVVGVRHFTDDNCPCLICGARNKSV